jgi:hypothetical protein
MTSWPIGVCLIELVYKRESGGDSAGILGTEKRSRVRGAEVENDRSGNHRLHDPEWETVLIVDVLTILGYINVNIEHRIP